MKGNYARFISEMKEKNDPQPNRRLCLEILWKTLLKLSIDHLDKNISVRSIAQFSIYHNYTEIYRSVHKQRLQKFKASIELNVYGIPSHNRLLPVEPSSNEFRKTKIEVMLLIDDITEL